jgi:hypothetical protein
MLRRTRFVLRTGNGLLRRLIDLWMRRHFVNEHRRALDTAMMSQLVAISYR